MISLECLVLASTLLKDPDNLELFKLTDEKYQCIVKDNEALCVNRYTFILHKDNKTTTCER